MKESQKRAILKLLKCGKWVGLPRIMGLWIANYRGRISDLREDGYDIENVCINKNGEKRSYYVLRNPKWSAK